MEGPPLKKPRTDKLVDKKDSWEPVVPPGDYENGGKYTKEVDVGITEFVNRDFEGFDCILKYKCAASFTELTLDTLISWSTKLGWTVR